MPKWKSLLVIKAAEENEDDDGDDEDKEKMSTRTTKVNAKTITDVNGTTTGNSEGQVCVEKSVSKSKFPHRKTSFRSMTGRALSSTTT